MRKNPKINNQSSIQKTFSTLISAKHRGIDHRNILRNINSSCSDQVYPETKA
jgi:hypothetical protein